MTGTLIEWELRRAGRLKSTYAFRTGGLTITIFILLLAWLMHFVSQYDRNAKFLEMVLLKVAPLPLQFIAVLGVAPILSALTLAAERRNRTLGLLLQTGISPGRLWCAKFVAVFAQSAALLLVSLPLVVAVSRLAGTSMAAALGQWFMFVCGGAALCAAGLFCSAHSLRPEEALLRSGAVVVAWTGAGLLAAYAVPLEFRWAAYLFAPAFIPAASPETPVLAGAMSLAGTCGIGLCFAAATIRQLPGLVLAEPQFLRRAAARKRKLESSRQAVAALVRAATPDLGMGQLGHMRIGPVLFVVILCVVACVPFIGGFMITPFMIFLLVNNVHVLRQEGMLDLLRVSPVKDRELGQVLHYAQWRLALLFFPATLAMTLMGYYLNQFMFTFPGTPQIGLGVMLAGSLPGFFVTASIGCWASTWRNSSVLRNAVLGTVAAFLLPMIVAMALMVPLMIALMFLIQSPGPLTANPAGFVYLSTGITAGGSALAAILMYFWLIRRFRLLARDVAGSG